MNASPNCHRARPGFCLKKIFSRYGPSASAWSKNSGSTMEGQLPVSCISAAVLAVNAKSSAVTSLPSLHFTPSSSSTSVVQNVSPSTASSSSGVGKSAASDGTQSYRCAEYA